MKFSSNIQVIQAQFDGLKLKPIYAHGVEDAGCDLKANIPNPITIAPWKSVWVGTRVHLAMPEGMFALQAPRSGLSCNHGITLANAPGIIDPGYRGEIRCKLVNLSDEPYTVYPLERIAQLVFLPFVNAAFMTCDSLPESSRGEDGYGSTGAM